MLTLANARAVGEQAPVATVALVTLLRSQLGHSGGGRWRVLKLEVHKLLHRMLTPQEPLGSNFYPDRELYLQVWLGIKFVGKNRKFSRTN